MFRFNKSLDVITLFHQPRLQPSVRALALLKRMSAEASETATEDQASDHSSHNKLQRAEFDLDVQEEPPTSDQLRSILEYLGTNRAKDVVDGSRDVSDAIKRLTEDRKRFRAPVVGDFGKRLVDPLIDAKIVDWNNGKAVVGDNESEILKMLTTLSKEN